MSSPQRELSRDHQWNLLVHQCNVCALARYCSKVCFPSVADLVLKQKTDQMSVDLSSEPLQLCEEPESERDVRVRDRWARLVRAARRLAFRRKVWGLLGGWLREVRQRGQLAIRDPR